MLLALHSKNRRLVYVLLPFYVFLCMATVYIQAHYAVDAIAGLISAFIIYYALLLVSKPLKH
jgi:membrane-associated phospholipid phosphatase